MAEAEETTVLVADDEPSTLALVAGHLRTKSYKVIEASDGDDAWELACEHLPDLVVLDVMMPGMSGWEVCRKIRETVSLAHTAVVMLTGIGENLNEMTSPLYGADAYVDKPFEFAKLDEQIRVALKARESRRELSDVSSGWDVDDDDVVSSISDSLGLDDDPPATTASPMSADASDDDAPDSGSRPRQRAKKPAAPKAKAAPAKSAESTPEKKTAAKAKTPEKQAGGSAKKKAAKKKAAKKKVAKQAVKKTKKAAKKTKASAKKTKKVAKNTKASAKKLAKKTQKVAKKAAKKTKPSAKKLAN
jgi:CheY-like chemotaxis protein